MEPVAARDEVAGNLVIGAVVPIADARMCRVDVVDAQARCLEQEHPAAALARRDQILDDLALPVDGDRAAAGELGEVDVMPRSAKRKVDAVVPQALRQAIADAHRVHQVHRALLEDAGTDALDDVLARVALDDHRVDAGLVQQLTQNQARGARADDRDLCAVRVHAIPTRSRRN